MDAQKIKHDKIHLYKEFTAQQLSDVLGTELDKLELKEIEVGGFFGDYLIAGEYKFKKIYGTYTCMETPTDKHENKKINIVKNPGDSLNYKK